MTRLRLYLDEDSMQQALVVGLCARNVDVLTASDAGMINKSDEEHLRWAAGEQLRRLLDLLSKKTPAEMRCQLEYLSAWGA